MESTSLRSRLLLHDVRHVSESTPVLLEVFPQVLERLEVRVDATRLRIGNEHQTIGAGEHELARGVVINLPRNGEELQPHAHAAHPGQPNRQKIEVEGAIDRRRQAHHLAPVLGSNGVILFVVSSLA